MGFLSQFEDFLFSSFSFHKNKRRQEWDEQYGYYPTATEIVEKWNVTPSLIYKKREE